MIDINRPLTKYNKQRQVLNLKQKRNLNVSTLFSIMVSMGFFLFFIHRLSVCPDSYVIVIRSIICNFYCKKERCWLSYNCLLPSNRETEKSKETKITTTLLLCIHACFFFLLSKIYLSSLAYVMVHGPHF